MFRTSTLALSAVAAAALFPAPGHASSAVACSVDGQYESAGTTFTVRGNVVCSGALQGQIVKPQSTSFAIDGRRSALPGQACLGTGQGRLTMRVLKRTGWVPLRSQVRLLATDGGTLDGSGRAGDVAASLLGTTTFTQRGLGCKGPFRARFTLAPAVA